MGGENKEAIAPNPLQWSRAAADLVFSEFGVTVPEKLVAAYQAQHLADSKASRDPFGAEALYSEAILVINKTPLPPSMLRNEEPSPEGYQWLGSIWWESESQSLLKIYSKDLADAFFEMGEYGGDGKLMN